MVILPAFFTACRSSIGLLLLTVLTFLFSSGYSSETQAACPGSDGSGSGIVFQSCTEVKISSNARFMDLPLPANVNSGDMLVVAITVDGNELMAVPNGWIHIGRRANSATTALYYRIAGASEPASYRFQWGTNELAYGYVMHFTGASFLSATSSFGASATVTFPSTDTFTDDSMVIRVGGFDDDDLAIDPPVIVPGHSNITADSSSQGTGTASGAAAYVRQPIAGPTGTATMSLTAPEEWVAFTLALFPGVGLPTNFSYLCPIPTGFSQGSQIITVKSCSEGKASVESQSLTIPAPPSSSMNDFMLAFISSDGSEQLVEPAGWSVVYESPASPPTFGIYKKFVGAAEPASYTWNISTNEQLHGYILLMDNASGGVTLSTASGNSDAPRATPVTTERDYSLVIQASSHDEADLFIDPARVLPYLYNFFNVIADASSIDPGSVSSQAVASFVSNAGDSPPVAPFVLTGVEEWRAAMVAVEPHEFRVSMPDATVSTCSEQEITISVTDKEGNVVPGFSGTVFLSNSEFSAAQWRDAGALNGNLFSLPNFAFYNFVESDNGVAVFNYTPSTVGTSQIAVQQTISSGVVIRENPLFSPTFTVDDDCKYRVSYDDAELGVCSTERVTISVYDSEGNLGKFVDHQIDISSATGSSGDYSLLEGEGSLDNGVLGDGAASYVFSSADEGQVVLGFTDPVVETVNFDIVSPQQPSYLVDSGFDPNLQVLPCQLRFSHDTLSDVCSSELITLSVSEPSGALGDNFTGTVTLSNAAGEGRWSINDAVNSLADLGSGAVEYTFDLADGGDIVLDFAISTGHAALDFDASVASPGYNAPVGVSDPALEVANCSVRITTQGQGNVCAESSTLSLEIRNRDNLPGSLFEGALALSNDTGNGNYIGTTGAGTLDSGSQDDGVGIYEFALADAGTVDIEFQTDVAENLSFLVTSAYLDFNANASSEDLQVLRCEFRIAHSGSTDVCSVLEVTVSVFNELGVAVSDYAGTVSLSTDSGDGTWSNFTGAGALVDPVEHDGNASYNFVPADAGSAVLHFRTLVPEALNLNVVDGVSSDSNALFDPDVMVANCSFRITVSEGQITACSETVQLTLTVANSAESPDDVAIDFAGEVSISSDTLRGDWELAPTQLGSLIDTVADDGMVRYQFSGLEGGQLQLLYRSSSTGTANFDVISDAIVVDGNFDPSVEITSCLPAITSSVCERVLQSTNLSISAGRIDPAEKNRMVIMLVYQAGTVPVFDAPTFAGAAMTRIGQVQNPAGAGTSIEMWGLLDADMPLAAGSYSGAYALNGTPSNQPSMCLLELSDVAQEFPQFSVLNPNLGPINSSISTAITAPQELQTSITTAMNNALILSAGLSDRTTEPNSWFDSNRPNPPLSIVIGAGNNDARPAGGTAVGSAGRLPSAGFITVHDIDNEQAFNGTAHLVASFNPLVDGPPLGGSYEAVHLFDTLSGNLNYVAIGNSIRRSQFLDCRFIRPEARTTATLTLPAGAVVAKAYLYWSGSGSLPNGTADSQVNFGPNGSELSITADAMFGAEGFIAGVEYFAGYKEVTSLITGSGPYSLIGLQAQGVQPWNPALCAGGWSLIVFYEHPNERLRVLNLFHGIQPFQYSELTLTPRNFRLSPADGQFEPNGQITHFTVEGDTDPTNGMASGEGLGIQAFPGSETFIGLSNSFQSAPDGPDDFNNTVTRPIYTLNQTTGYFEFDVTAGLHGDGYEADNTQAYGIDIDTHYLSGANPGDILYNHANVPGFEAESLTTRYQTENDFVLLVNEVIGVSSTAVADIELTLSQSGDFIVDGTGSYHFEVRNNGDDTTNGGFASGEIRLAGSLPPGLTITSIGGEGWLCVYESTGGFLCIFDIGSNCDLTHGCSVAGELAGGQALPTVTATVAVGSSNAFPLLNNEVKLTGRVLHSGGSCGYIDVGLLPAPDSCARSPQFDNVFDLQDGAIELNDLLEKSGTNNNVDSVVSEIRGNTTDLSVDKLLSGILEEAGSASYSLLVTNHGPGATTADIIVRDTEPSNITFSEASGAGWSCTLAPMICTYSGSLLPGTSALINLTVNVTGAPGDFVSNTATVETSAFDFDINGSNNADTHIAQIVPAPVASNERFLLSVSEPTNATTIGGLGPLENDDYFVYDPLLDRATDFYDNSIEGFDLNEADGVHLFDNGKIALSARQPSSIGSNNLSFQPEDIVIYDPISKTASLFFDGSSVFFPPVDGNANIDAIYISDDLTEVYLSTAGASRISKVLMPGAQADDVLFERGDIVRYRFAADESTQVVIDASAPQVFGSEVQVDGLYRRVDENDYTSSIDAYVLSIDENAAQSLGACAECNPASGTFLSRDDLALYDLTGGDAQTESLFRGDQPLGVFTPTSDDRSIDAIHVLEESDLGHFSISQSQAGSTCAAGQITISKHAGLSHEVDQNYAGSIRLSTNIAQGDWSIAQGEGFLDNGAVDDGSAVYTFVPADNGQVTLFLSETTPSTINVDVTNGVVQELGTEDPNFDFNHVLTTLSYRDEFNDVSFENNSGSADWSAGWVEADDVAAGPAAGNVSIANGRLQLTSSPGSSVDPALSRVANLASFSLTEDVILRYDFSYEFLNAGVDQVVVEVRPGAGQNFVEVHSHIGIGGSNPVPVPVSLNLTTLLGNPVWTSGAGIRIRISGGYTSNSMMFIDNLELATETTACDVSGGIDHYEIRIDGITRDATNPVAGIQCLGSVITLTPHSQDHLPTTVEEGIVLQNTQNKGDWTLLQGSGAFDNGGLGDGTATYDFSLADSAAVFRFNYTDPSTDPELVNFNIGSVFGTFAGEDPTLAVESAGLLFFNESNQSALDPFPMQIAGKPSNVGADSRLITLEAVRSSDAEPDVCLPLLAPGNTINVEFGLECLDPSSCATNIAEINAVAIPVTDDNAADFASAYSAVALEFATQPNSGHSAAEVALNFVDVGLVQLHARMDIPLNNAPDGLLSGDKLVGSSNSFIVRPFSYSVDFSGDRAANGQGPAAISFAEDASSSVFAVAGEDFSVTASAVAWQAEDDLDNDGFQDMNYPLGDSFLAADLSDNPKTPNFGSESDADDYWIRMIPAGDLPTPVHVHGEFSQPFFTNVVGGEQTQLTSYSEVGVIDSLVLLGSSTPPHGIATYFSAGPVLVNAVENIGRFVPDHFLLENPAVLPRPLANSYPSCIAPSSFSYLGEEFGITATLSARNLQGEVTTNYTGDFAKLKATDFNSSSFAALAVHAGPDVLYNERIEMSWLGLAWNPHIAGTDRGMGSLAGNLIFNRQSSGAEDGPFPGLVIALDVMDSDGVGLLLNLDSDDLDGNDLAMLGTANFRYGRLRLADALGPETEPLDVNFYIDQWNGAAFEINTEDDCTALLYDAAEPQAADRTFHFVPGSYLDQLLEGDSIIEKEQVLAGNNLSLSLFNGGNTLQATGENAGSDRPLEVSAPGEGREGSALLEFDLSSPALPYPLDFLSYDWRTPGVDPLEEEAGNGDGVYTDNPRALLEFNQYRGHDRIINWQEIYNSPD